MIENILTRLQPIAHQQGGQISNVGSVEHMAELRRSPRLKERADRVADEPASPNPVRRRVSMATEATPKKPKAGAKAAAHYDSTFSTSCASTCCAYVLGFLPHACLVLAIGYVSVLVIY